MGYKASSATEIEDAAAIWCARVLGADTSYDDDAFREWISQSPEHRVAFDEMVQVWLSLDGLDRNELPKERAMEIDVPVVAAESWRRRALGRRGVLALAASVVVAVVGVTYYQAQRPDVYATETGALMTVELGDGSKLRLDGSSEVLFRESSGARNAWLNRGRASFAVARDPRRPFSVNLRNQVVVATGTEFSVEELPDQVRVHLYSGQVTVQGPGQSLVLSPGDKLAIFDDGRPHILLRDRSENDLQWMAGNLIFQEESLSVAVEQVNRHSSLRIAVPAYLAEQKISGVFKAGETRAFVAAVCELFRLRPETSDGVMRLVADTSG